MPKGKGKLIRLSRAAPLSLGDRRDEVIARTWGEHFPEYDSVVLEREDRFLLLEEEEWASLKWAIEAVQSLEATASLSLPNPVWGKILSAQEAQALVPKLPEGVADVVLKRCVDPDVEVGEVAYDFGLFHLYLGDSWSPVALEPQGVRLLPAPPLSEVPGTVKPPKVVGYTGTQARWKLREDGFILLPESLENRLRNLRTLWEPLRPRGGSLRVSPAPWGVLYVEEGVLEGLLGFHPTPGRRVFREEELQLLASLDSESRGYLGVARLEAASLLLSEGRFGLEVRPAPEPSSLLFLTL